MSDDSATLEDLKARVEALSKRIKTLQEEHDERIEELEAENRELRDENRELRERVDEIEERTDLLDVARQSEEMSAEERRLFLLQHLHREAKQRAQNGRKEKASLTPEQAKRALQHPNLDRTTIYDDLRRAAEMIDDDRLVWYESRYGNTQLKINLEAGEVPDELKRRTNGGGQ